MPFGHLIIRGVELSNNNIFLCYSKNFFLHKKVKSSRKFSFIGDYFFTEDLKESIDKFEQYKQWFDLNTGHFQTRIASFYEILKKQDAFKKKKVFINYLISEIITLEERLDKTTKENEKLKIELAELKKKFFKS